MASDSLNQVGKYINQTGKNANRALKRARPIQPRLERARDVFDENIAFEMSFVKEDNDERVLIDLFFTLPPPIRGCDIGCIHTRCEEFDFPSGGNHYVTLAHPYISGSLSVFINGSKVDDVNINKSSPDAGELFFQSSSSGPDTVAVCYVFDECGIPGLCPQFKPSFIGGTLLFSDKFDRAVSVDTYGGKGYWYDSGSFGTYAPPISVPIGEIEPDTLALDTSKQYVFEDIRVTGLVSEIILAFDARAWVNIPSSFAQQPSSLSISQFNPYGGGSSVQIKVSGDVILSRNYRYLTNTGPFASQGISWQFGTKFQTLHTTLDLRQELFIRFYYDGDICKVKIWPQDQPEPSNWDWLEFDMALPTLAELSGIGQPAAIEVHWVKPDILGGTLGTSGGTAGFPVGRQSNGALQAIEHWAGSISGVYGRWLYSGFDNTATWSRSIAHTYAGFYWDSDTESDSTFLSSTNGSTATAFPVCNVTSGWNTFDPLNGDGKPIYIEQTIPAWSTVIGKTVDMKLTGEVSWDRFRETLYTPPMTILLQTFSHGLNGPPGTVGDYFFGTTQVTILANFQQWYPFEIVIPATGDGWIQWGCRFQEETQEITNKLGGYTGNFFFEATSTASINFRRIYAEAVTRPIGGARPFCPEDF